VAIFDPAPLKEIAVELGHTIRSRPNHRFDAVGQRIMASALGVHESSATRLTVSMTAAGVGAGLCLATVSRRRRRDGGDSAKASAQRTSGETVRGNPEPDWASSGMTG
jgi:hypothetical protein